ncbi:DUF1963 domain-containing protein [Kordia jejudonensis]|uniref:DUF1963 domain-containing protein n=1 Tax=Kordia jejudonensis TaxID=1348245 RepID=UPI000629821A|nr:DUF1963 domain-containing protein [Kordia jejudonensis]
MDIKKEIDRLINEYFGKQSELIASILKPSIGIKTSEFNNTEILSKFGGVPKAKNGFSFPKDKNYSLLCQLDLSEFKILDVENILPAKGILYFFIDNNIQTFSEESSSLVFYQTYDKKADLVYQQQHLEHVYKEIKLNFFEYYSFPSYQENERLKLSEEIDDDLIDEITEEILFNTQVGVGHQILGAPQALQGGVHYHFAHRYLGFKDYNLDESQKKQITQIQDNFILLLQIDLEDTKLSFSEFNMGVLYFGILKDDLNKLKFDRTVLIFQST